LSNVTKPSGNFVSRYGGGLCGLAPQGRHDRPLTQLKQRLDLAVSAFFRRVKKAARKQGFAPFKSYKLRLSGIGTPRGSRGSAVPRQYATQIGGFGLLLSSVGQSTDWSLRFCPIDNMTASAKGTAEKPGYDHYSRIVGASPVTPG
jgi:hypothetical protein